MAKYTKSELSVRIALGTQAKQILSVAIPVRRALRIDPATLLREQ